MKRVLAAPVLGAGNPIGISGATVAKKCGGPC